VGGGAPQTRFARTDEGFSLAYQTVGVGPPDIVLIPSLTGIDAVWDEPSYAAFLEHLATLGRLILFDVRGFGASDPVPAGALPTPEEWMGDTRAVLAAVGSETCHLIAHGASCFIGMLFAAQYPGRTKSLVLVEATARLREDRDYPIGVSAEALERFLKWNDATWGTEDSVNVHAPSKVGDQAFRRWLARFERISMSRSANAAQTRWATMLDMRAVLPSIHTPTLVLSRRDCLMIPSAQGRFLADAIAGARYVEVPGRDYWFFTEHAHQILDHIGEFVTGHRLVSQPDRALTTVMFTDIVDSTRRAVRMGDHQWARVLDHHDAIADSELKRHGGRKVNPTGDGLLATFDGPARAVRCALAICEAMGELGIELRAGVHTGEVELRGDDIGGVAVHIGQRVSALAPPGDVYVSRTVADLVLGSDLTLEPRGEHELKGIPGTWALFAATG
jgi:class 3 adenylate cyclase/pimeloyl-ACP methyl ester carboxylesterase